MGVSQTRRHVNAAVSCSGGIGAAEHAESRATRPVQADGGDCWLKREASDPLAYRPFTPESSPNFPRRGLFQEI